ncbi:T9SS type A sorting domain-containing protein [bacterium]|nr:T9SS type A sorting domain-containing protein [bacterium]
MKRLRIAVLLVLLVLGFSHNTRAATITILDAPGLPAHPAEWAAVAASMGHLATIVPISTLDGTAWVSSTDVLIITDPYYPYTATHTDNVWYAVNEGVGVYIQGEDDPAFASNVMFEDCVNTTGFAGFSWIAPVPDDHVAAITGPVAIDPNPITPLVAMSWAAEAVHAGPMGGTTTNMWVGPHQVGFLHDEVTNDAAGLLAINTDYTWILPVTFSDLMENYIQVLLTGAELGQFAHLTPTGPATIPAGGGPVPYMIELENVNPYTWPITVWVRAILPSGAVYASPLAGPVPVMVPPMSTMGPYASPGPLPPVGIPGFAPAGEYFIQSVVTNGFAGWTEAYDSDFFSVIKAAAAGQDSEIDPGDLPVNLFGTVGHPTQLASSQSNTVQSGDLPSQFALTEAYPNPFNPSTSVAVMLAEAAQLTVKVYDVQGREVTTLAHGTFAAGTHSLTFDAHGLASGVYFLRATVPGQLVQTRKLVLLR